jgi:hypothetical protein
MELVRRGLITQQLAEWSQFGKAPKSELPVINATFAAAYTGHEADFKSALLTARDYLGRLMERFALTANSGPPTERGNTPEDERGSPTPGNPPTVAETGMDG